MNIHDLIRLVNEIRLLPHETEWVEIKSSTIKPDEKLGDYISGLSNAACINNQTFAYLVLGVDNDDHSIKGTNYNFMARKHGNDDLEFWLKRYLSPSIRFDYFSFKYDANHKIEIFRIPAAIGEPVTFKGKPSIRIGTSLTHLKDYPHYAKIIYNSQDDWSAKVIDNATIADLESEAVQLARQVYKEKLVGKAFYNDIDKWADEVFLDKAKLTINGKITNTAIILLGKPESAHYLSPAVAQITWKLDTEEKAYEHFEIPLFTSINEVLRRIRNVKYKFFPNNQLIATEVLKYDPEVILEALNNCIAHQDYKQYARILLTEQTGKLIFSNAGGFFEGVAEDYTLGKKTPKKYRNRWLADAMVTLNMIDSMGYGIHKMYKSQKQRFFPLPDYSKSTRDEVVLEIYGHSIDENYSKLLIEQKDNLDLTDAILLDKIQKSQPITDNAAKMLKKKGLIEGRKPNYYISAQIAEITNQKAEYTRNKGLDKEVLMSFIIKHIENHGFATREEINKLLMDKLPDYMDDKQRKKKIENILQEMKRDKIKNIGSNRIPKWVNIRE